MPFESEFDDISGMAVESKTNQCFVTDTTGKLRVIDTSVILFPTREETGDLLYRL